MDTYTRIGEDGNDALDCGATTYTTGTELVVVTREVQAAAPTVEPEAAAELTPAEIQGLINAHLAGSDVTLQPANGGCPY